MAISRAGASRPRRTTTRALALPVTEQVANLVGLEQAGDAEEVHLLLRTDVHLARVAELGPVVEHPVEGRLRAERLERHQLLVAGGASACWACCISASSAAKMSPSSVILRPSTWSRSTSISEAWASSIGTDGTKIDAVSPRLRARTKRPTAWAKNSGVDGGGRVDPDGQPGHVDALGDHPHGDHPA